MKFGDNNSNTSGRVHAYNFVQYGACLHLPVQNFWGLLYAPVTSTWPHLRCDVGLEEGEYK